MKPNSRPRLSAHEVSSILSRFGVTAEVAILGVRGYYRNTMGEVGENDRGIYDDAIFIQSPNVSAAYNANTDPSIYRRAVAVLEPGVWMYRVGIHGLSKPLAQRYEALVQASPVLVRRDQTGLDKGWFGINIHRGGYNTTSSLGCQTLYPDQWLGFIGMVKAELSRAKQTTIPYLLINEADLR